MQQTLKHGSGSQGYNKIDRESDNLDACFKIVVVIYLACTFIIWMFFHWDGQTMCIIGSSLIHNYSRSYYDLLIYAFSYC